MHDVDARAGIEDFHQLLPRARRDGQDLREPVRHPGRIVEREWLDERQIAWIALRQRGDDPLEHLCARTELRDVLVTDKRAVLGQPPHFAAQQAVRLGPMRQQPEAARAAGADMHQAEILHVAVDDLGEAPDRRRHGRLVRLNHLAAALEQAYAERRVIAQAITGHVLVAGLEYSQWQQAARKQHRMQRKQWQFGKRIGLDS
ncbi:hypothetical protein DFQ28_000546 [Apophysomyces sp. BC1034]|nr:hypothetical protein DFQ30_008432 [Apophysomyces sp. BC1015]KAG0194300.1 hypothetical protein DFQ28_000546 [Apophysomyces sp. BC1034]